eukprot:SAG31_NODE_1403_length_8489_cov_15.730751_10_plen_108_part_00
MTDSFAAKEAESGCGAFGGPGLKGHRGRGQLHGQLHAVRYARVSGCYTVSPCDIDHDDRCRAAATRRRRYEIDVFCLRELSYENTRNHLFSAMCVQKTRLATTITMS